MQKAITTLRILAAEKTNWSSEGRDLTIQAFLGEFSHALTEEAIEYMAENYPDHLGKIFIDWAVNHKRRTPEQRAGVFVDSISKGLSPAIFLMAKHHGDKDLEDVEQVDSQPENVVSLFQR